MNHVMSKRKRTMLENHIKVIKENDEVKITQLDQALEYFLGFENGILSNGKTVKDYCEYLGINYFRDHKEVQAVRTLLSNLALTLISDGIPFGGIKEKGSLKKYGFVGSENEYKQIAENKKVIMLSKVKSTISLFPEGSEIVKHGNILIETCSKQLEFDF